MLATRRSVLIAGAATAAAATFARPSVLRAAAPFEQPPLPYAENALEPAISARTVGLHYGKHHAAYFKKLNELVPGTPFADMELEEVVRASAGSEADAKIFNQAAQAWNHVAYWDQMRPGGPTAPEGALAEEIDAAFGDFPSFKQQVATVSDGVFGTGWVWLTRDDDGRLALFSYEDGQNPVAYGKPAYLGIDLWEHAYYLDYENRKAEHITVVLDRAVNWSVVADRVAG